VGEWERRACANLAKVFGVVVTLLVADEELNGWECVLCAVSRRQWREELNLLLRADHHDRVLSKHYEDVGELVSEHPHLAIPRRKRSRGVSHLSGHGPRERDARHPPCEHTADDVWPSGATRQA
jgi:hypothetical protein